MKIMNLGNAPIGEVFLSPTKNGVNIVAHYYGKGNKVILELIKPSGSAAEGSIEKRLVDLESFKNAVIPFIEYYGREIANETENSSFEYKSFEEFTSNNGSPEPSYPKIESSYVVKNIDTRRP